jgi:serine/threonine protein kinase
MCAHSLPFPALYLQSMRLLDDPELYCIEPGDPVHCQQLRLVQMEVEALLSPVGDSPYIIKMLGVVVDVEGRPLKIVLELAELGSLETVIRSAVSLRRVHSPFAGGNADRGVGLGAGLVAGGGGVVADMLSLNDIGWWMWDAISGVAHMHHVGKEPVLHRDLTLNNLLVSSHHRVKVADIGVAVTGINNHSESFRMGSTLTLSPQAEFGIFDPAGDVYAWAMCVCLAVLEAFQPASLATWGKREVRAIRLNHVLGHLCAMYV